MTAPIGPGDWLISLVNQGPLRKDGIYQIWRLRDHPNNAGCGYCGRCKTGVDLTVDDPDAWGVWCLSAFRPAGRGGMFDSLLTAKPVRVGEDA